MIKIQYDFFTERQTTLTKDFKIEYPVNLRDTKFKTAFEIYNPDDKD